MIKTKDIEFKYNNSFDKMVLNGINIDIKNGEFVAILGHNGSGKSTLAKHFNAILLPMGGSVFVKDMDTKDEKLLYEIRQTIGMVFQNPDNQIVATIVEEDVAFAPENLGLPSSEIRRRVDWALDIVGMSSYSRHAPHLLSGGQKQRIAIAGVLAMNPNCIVLDEPTAMLDPIGRREVISTLKKLNKDEGITIVLITHNMDEAIEADRVVVMSKGSIVLDDTPRQVFSDVAQIKALGLDVPQVCELMYELKNKGLNIKSNALTIDEAYSELAPKIKKPPEIDIKTTVKTSNETIIDVQSICYDYSVGGPFEKRALEDVSVKIKKGEIIGIIGHTGSGKSTLVQHFNGLIKPTSGRVLVNGTDISAKKVNLKSIRASVGLVFQYPEHQLFEETVRRDIAFSPQKMGLSEEEVERRVIQCAKMVGLSKDVLEKSPFELSGGQKRRVAIAGVLAMEPDVLVLDEPTAGLDPHGREEILRQIRKLHKDYDKTVILVSHGMEDIANTVEMLYVMNNGKIVLSGTPLEVYKNYRLLEKIGLTAPQITKLMDKLCGINVCTVEQAMEYLVPMLSDAEETFELGEKDIIDETIEMNDEVYNELNDEVKQDATNEKESESNESFEQIRFF